jgi:transcriptional regulator with XRE-family HTH domain
MTTQEQWDPRLRQLGEYIRMQRHLADLSLRGLSDLTQVSNAYLSQLERGLHQPSLRVLQSIAEALNLSAETLVAQAGLTRPEAAHSTAVEASPPAVMDTETAIRNDVDLTAEERDALLRVYQSFKQSRPSA